MASYFSVYFCFVAGNRVRVCWHRDTTIITLYFRHLIFFCSRPLSVYLNRARFSILLRNFGKLPKTSTKNIIKLVYATLASTQYYRNVAFRVGVGACCSPARARRMCSRLSSWWLIGGGNLGPDIVLYHQGHLSSFRAPAQATFDLPFLRVYTHYTLHTVPRIHARRTYGHRSS